jgi:hypothetical protein
MPAAKLPLAPSTLLALFVCKISKPPRRLIAAGAPTARKMVRFRAVECPEGAFSARNPVHVAMVPSLDFRAVDSPGSTGRRLATRYDKG